MKRSEPSALDIMERDGAAEAEACNGFGDRPFNVFTASSRRMHKSCDEHVATRARSEIEVDGAGRQPAFRVTSAAKKPAPKPLSMLTVTTCGVHELSIPSSAAMPPSEVP